MRDFSCTVLTPYRRIFAGKVESVRFSTHDGRMQILAGHEDIVAPVAVGALVLELEGGAKLAAVTEGFVAVKKSAVEIFVEAAEWAEEIDRERAARSLERAEGRLRSETLEWSLSRARAAALRARNRLAVAASAGASASADAVAPAGVRE